VHIVNSIAALIRIGLYPDDEVFMLIFIVLVLLIDCINFVFQTWVYKLKYGLIGLSG